MEVTMKWGKTLLALVSAAFLVAVMAYFAGVFHTDAEHAAKAAPAVDGLRVEVQAREVAITEPVPGTVSATDETLVGSRILATITAMHVGAGDRVERGDLLVEFDDSSQRSVLAQRQQAEAGTAAALEEATAARDRAVQLYERGNLSRADYDRAITSHRMLEADLERARRAVAEAQAQLDYTKIVAPMSGTVVDRYAEAGDTALPGQSLLRLFNPGRLRVEALLRESLIGRVAQGQQIQALIGALDARLDAVVEEIVPSADPASRTFLIKALLPPAPDVFPGMFARLEIPLREEERLFVPRAAIIQSGQLDFVYIETEAGPERRSVRVGAEAGDDVEITSGLSAGDVVVVPGPVGSE
jgi:RND family efflux transporter MFP subunit